jgi:cell wall-associated NlpC family hydrolase
MSTQEEQRHQVSAIALSWVGTPFHDNAEIKGAGVDCARLLKRVWEESGLIECFTLPHYSPQHMAHLSEERFMGWVRKFAHEIKQDDARPADLVLYKIGKCYSHGAIIIEPGLPNIVHAWYPIRMVMRSKYLDGILGDRRLAPRFFSRW